MLNQYIQCVQNDNKNVNAGETIEAIKNAASMVVLFNGMIKIGIVRNNSKLICVRTWV